jgi:hypothetical protein
MPDSAKPERLSRTEIYRLLYTYHPFNGIAGQVFYSCVVKSSKRLAPTN